MSGKSCGYVGTPEACAGCESCLNYMRGPLPAFLRMLKLQTGQRQFAPHIRFSKFGDLEERRMDGYWYRVTGRREHILRWRAAQRQRERA